MLENKKIPSITYHGLNNLFQDKINGLFDKHKEHYLLALEIKEKYAEYIQSNQISFGYLDPNLNYIKENDFFHNNSPLILKNGTWFFCFLIHLETQISTQSIQANIPLILGIKKENNIPSIQIKNDTFFNIENDEKLNIFFDLINKELKNNISVYFENFLEEEIKFNMI